MGVSLNGGTQQPWVFLLKMIILGCFGVYHHFKKHPYHWNPIFVLLVGVILHLPIFVSQMLPKLAANPRPLEIGFLKHPIFAA